MASFLSSNTVLTSSATAPPNRFQCNSITDTGLLYLVGMIVEHILLLCGVIAGPFFIVVFLIEGSLRSGYQPMRQPVSSLAIGPRGWVQKANFLITGVLMLACAFGLSSALVPYGGSFWAPILVGIFALGLIGAGMFTTDITGLPREKGFVIKRTKSGILHDLSSLPVFVALFFAECFVFAHLFAVAGEYGWEIYSIISGTLFIIGFVLAGVGFSGLTKLSPIGGLLQRLTIGIGWVWLALVVAHLL